MPLDRRKQKHKSGAYVLKGIEIKPPTLAKYLNEFRRGKDKKKDTPPPPAQAEKTALMPQPDRPARVGSGGFTITPDTPLDEL